MTIAQRDAYRDEAGSARQRIAQLEATLGLRAPPWNRRPPRVTAGRLLLLLTVAILSSVAGVCGMSMHLYAEIPDYVAIRTPVPSTSPPGAALRAPLGWYEPELTWNQHHGPWVAETRGTRLFVGMLWERGARENGLHVAAFDRSTLAMRWISGSLPSLWAPGLSNRHHFVVSGDDVVLADSAGTIRVFDLATGAERSTTPMRRGIQGMCMTEIGPRRILLGFGAYQDPNSYGSMFPWELHAEEPFFFDPRDKRLTRAPPRPVDSSPYCMPDPYCHKGAAAHDGCEQLGSQQQSPEIDTPWPMWKTGQVWQWGEDRVTLGTHEPSEQPAAVGWDAKTRAVIWKAGALEAPGRAGRRDASGWPSARLAQGVFYYGYATEGGPYHVVGIDTKSGGRRFDLDVPGSGEGSDVAYLAAEDGDLFAPIGDAMVVIDGATGAVRGRLEGK